MLKMSSNSNSGGDPYREYLDSELASEGERSVHGIVSQITRYCGLKFGSLVLSQPFEAAQLLRQLQSRDGHDEAIHNTSDGATTLSGGPGAATAGTGVSMGSSPPLDVSYGMDRYYQTTDPLRLERQRKVEEERLTRSQSHRLGEFYSASTNAPVKNANSLPEAMVMSGESLRQASPALMSRDPSGYFPPGPVTCYTRLTSQWPLQLDKRRSLFHTIGEIASKQGFFSLWQGIFSSWAHDVLMDLGRATMEEALDTSQWVRDLSLWVMKTPSLNINSTTTIAAVAGGTNNNGSLTLASAMDLGDDLLTPAIVAGLAQGIVGTVLSPLELARTRLMAQSVWPFEQKYRNAISVLRNVRSEEGGTWKALYRNPLLTFACYLTKPLNRILPLALINALWTPSEDAHWAITGAWLAVQNLALCVPLLWMLPLETIRRRLMVQFVPKIMDSESAKAYVDLGKSSSLAESTMPLGLPHHLEHRESRPVENINPFITRVRLATTPYHGAFNCLWRMTREEGVASLYQGWSLQVCSTIASFVSTFLVEMGDEDFAEEDLEGF